MRSSYAEGVVAEGAWAFLSVPTFFSYYRSLALTNALLTLTNALLPLANLQCRARWPGGHGHGPYGHDGPWHGDGGHDAHSHTHGANDDARWVLGGIESEGGG